MKAGIRFKFAGILILAAALPLALGLLAIYVLGNSYYRESAGEIFENRARQMVSHLEIAVQGHADALHDWLALSGFYQRVAAINERRPDYSDEEFLEEAIRLQRRWPDLPEDSPKARWFMENELALELDEFQKISPQFAEILVTDDIGHLVAATNKPTNYIYTSIQWWQEGIKRGFRDPYIEGVNFDESAGVYSFDLIIPLRDWRNPCNPPSGVAKGVLIATPIFYDLAAMLAAEEAKWKVVLEDGRIIFGPVPHETNIPDKAAATIRDLQTGWMIRRLNEDELRMTGFARLPWMSNLGVNENQLAEMFVLVHESAAEILAPVRIQLVLLTGAGASLIMICFLGGLYAAQKQIIRPIRLLQKAARDISRSARPDGDPVAGTTIRKPSLPPSTRDFMDRIARIKSHDELGDLASDFNSMAKRVLNYHAHLESEIKTKMFDMQGDLVIAREFQEALMPNEYPSIPTVATPGSVSLQFNHIYKPASTVGGDFFNILKLSENRAGIFIADVMGHGSRSALVTAIVATLLHDLAPKASDPGEFMTVLNQQFHHLIQHSKQLIFVTAFYMVIDTAERQALFATAGHPPPLLVERKKSTVKPLLHAMQNDTALGLLEDSAYACFSRPINEADMFLLFTDGLFEALNPMGEEFGVNKLIDVVHHSLSFSAGEIGRRIMNTIDHYSDFANQGDDICLVTVEINEPSNARQAVEVGRDQTA